MPEFKDWFVLVVSSAAALIGAFNIYLNNKAGQEIAILNSRVVRVGEARKFASDIIQRYDNVVIDDKKYLSVRIARLSGLLALTNLMTQNKDDQGGLDVKDILSVIGTQAASYKEEIAELSTRATGAKADQLSAQYDRLTKIGEKASTALKSIDRAEAAKADAGGGTAAPVPIAAKSVFDGIRVDIFWCAGTDQSADALSIANGLFSKRPDPGMDWRVRALDIEKNARVGYQARGLVIRAETGEKAIAAALNKLAGPQFSTWLIAGSSPTRDYVSVFVCPS